jgi:hypothetical protein
MTPGTGDATVVSPRERSHVVSALSTVSAPLAARQLNTVPDRVHCAAMRNSVVPAAAAHWRSWVISNG